MSKSADGEVTSDRLTHAARARHIAVDLAKWHQHMVVSQSSMDDAMRAELALVSRQELVAAAVQTTSREAFRKIAVAKPVLRHRIIANYSAQSEGLTTDDMVDKLLESIDPQERHAHVASA